MAQLERGVLQGRQDLGDRMVGDRPKHEAQFLVVDGLQRLDVGDIGDALRWVPGEQDRVVVIEREILVSAQGPWNALSTGGAQIRPAGPVGQHPRGQERRAQGLVTPLGRPGGVMDQDADHGCRHGRRQGRSAPDRRRPWNALDDQQPNAQDEHDRGAHQVRGVEQHRHRERDPDDDAVPRPQVAPIEQRDGGRDRAQQGEDVGHGEPGEEGQGRANGQQRHQGVEIVDRGLWQGGAPECQEQVRRETCLHGGKEPERPDLVRRVEQQAIEDRPARDPPGREGDRLRVGGVGLGNDIAVRVAGDPDLVAVEQVVKDLVGAAVVFLGVVKH